MIIKTLVENISSELPGEFGLSLYFETGTHKFLFDTGASSLFADNAKKLGVDLQAVEFVILSHGHHDHGGGLNTFLAMNKTAKVFLKKSAFGSFKSEEGTDMYEDLGLDPSLKDNPRMVFTSDYFELADGVTLFSGVKGTNFFPMGNQSLFKLEEGKYIPDDFLHEQNMVVNENGKYLLVSGCSHRGIVNILQQFYFLFGRFPTHVIGGFHLYDHKTGKTESDQTLKGISKYLLSTGALYYTCHCTGVESYHKLKDFMGERIEYLPCGRCLTI